MKQIYKPAIKQLDSLMEVKMTKSDSRLEYVCGFYAVNKRHCIPMGLKWCVVCGERS